MDAKHFNRLLKEINNNDKAIEEIYRFYYSRAIKHFSLKYDLTLAEDATQDFFINLLKICDKQDYINNPTGWIYTCIDNIIKRKIQTESRYNAYVKVAAYSDSTELVENSIYVKQLLQKLNPMEQKIVYLTNWEGYSKKEVAEILNIKYDNVRKIYSRALKKLKKYL